jgi:AraC family transcriptional regulator
MAAGRAKLAIAQGVSVWVLEAANGFGDAHVHAHHAIQITTCLSGALALFNGEECVRASTIAVAADAPHQFDASGLLVFIFVEPESRIGRALGQMLFGASSLARLDITGLEAALEPLRMTFDRGLNVEHLLQAGRNALEALVPEAPGRLPDPRVQRIIDYAATHLDEPLDLAAASAGIYLSTSRLRHLFVEQTGLAFKTYLLWLRLMRALQVYADGASLTEAAHSAGFSDSAHFSRIFKRTFGLPATTLTRF